MAAPYFDYFANPFLALRMSRPAYKAQASYCHTAIEQAKLGAAFQQLLSDLQKAVDGFDANLTERGQSTAGTTGTYHAARKAWLLFVDDMLKDYVTPKLRKLPVYADFKQYSKSRLAAYAQPKLVTESQELLKLYAAQQVALGYPTLVADAASALKAVQEADYSQDAQNSSIDTARLALAGDRAAIARAQHRLKAQLELTFDDAEKVYSFFDFSAAIISKPGKRKPQLP